MLINDNFFPPNNSIIYVALSGGVDSAVSAALLLDKGYDVRAIYMHCFDKLKSSCKANEDAKDAVKIASTLGIPFEMLDFRKEYSNSVLKYLYDSYQVGITPNPDIYCNNQIKFGLFTSNVLKRHKNAYFATGHYARNVKNQKSILEIDNEYLLNLSHLLLSAYDSKKDQSYFLHNLVSNQEVLKRCIFPIGNYTKSKVREMAKRYSLHVHDKCDSQGICFVGNVKMREFLKDHVAMNAGDVINKNGKVIGSHNGYQSYTIGQRRGFDINVYKGVPMYVIDKNGENNILIVSEKKDAYTDEFAIDASAITPLLQSKQREDLNKINIELQLLVRVRNLGKKIPCRVKMLSDKDVLDEKYKGKKLLGVKLKEKEFGIASGQSAVFYLDDIVVGGGEIIAANTSYKRRINFGT